MPAAVDGVLPRSPEIEVEVALGGLGYKRVGNGQWADGAPGNAVTDLSLKVTEFDPELLSVEYICHVSGRGDSDRWLGRGERVNDDPRHQVLAVRARLVGRFSSLYELCYDGRHTVAQLLTDYRDGQVCGLPGISRSDGGGGPAWLYGLRFTVRRAF